MPSLSTSLKLKLAYVGIAAVDTWLSGSANPRAHQARVLTKPLLMPTLAASLITSPRAANSPLRTSTLVAQTGGWGGDLALMGDGPSSFLAGSGSFAVGHAAYISGFLANRSKERRPGPKAIAALWAATSPGMAFQASRLDRRLGPAIAGYSATLASTVAAATQLDPALPRSARRLTLAGAGLFMLSDSILGTRKFLLKNPPPRMESAVMATYTAAQFLLSEGAARAGSPA
ncbi:lysoplasmalogenase [Nocardioides marmoriginsengisoli]|uniref:Lysoplasmalogenase n=1 Tax=Nocardioides marmoriginsengisoli TaxID=661483 RepID=A0A3N0CPW3_9ACTN|nr:lysoplasmalogenase [Nocardioides marmoriginsengisoli]RNL65410.1 lysoplasmalogenase [Nocardioides marmoriginsengisoli]